MTIVKNNIDGKIPVNNKLSHKDRDFKKTWSKYLDIANITYDDLLFENNIDKIGRTICSVRKYEFYQERYGFFLSKTEIEHVMSCAINSIPKKESMYCPAAVMNKHGISYDEAASIIQDRKNKTSGTLENFIRRHGPELGEKKYKEFCEKSSHTKEKYIKKYGVDKGEEKWNEYLASKSSSLQKCIERHGEEVGSELYTSSNKKRRESQSLAGFCKKYGEVEGKIQWKISCSKRSVTKEKMIELYGEVEGSEKWQNIIESRSESSSLKYFIDQYGDAGEEKYKLCNMKKSPIYNALKYKHGEELAMKYYLDKKSLEIKDANISVTHKMKERNVWTASGAKNPSSKQSNEFFKRLEKKLGRPLQYGKKSNELSLFDEDNMCMYYYDCFDSKTNTIIEYHGTAFHPREGDHTWVNPFGRTYETAFSTDTNKKNYAMGLGYNYIVVWSDENKKDKINELWSILA